ncbi:hypothetical protein H7347_01695 [Corynebacterium sp. zg-331]|uniref:hypothetical protein n=1 Tax=unclassified Corynebacterium TaxID=2624378 RepID=UPI00128BFA6B|nr:MULTISPECIES: hypothetical protein [unclassified Corynebacterium]MBC3185300.1 hypothetical protein [Corynebacterium sp. zg-331]MPV51797.1 hypothetical protein [Corynebacterium sp. zg331]
MVSDGYECQRQPLLIGGGSSFVTVELMASYPRETVFREEVDPLRDFRDCERILGFAHTGEGEWERGEHPIGSAALWEVHDYYHRPRMLESVTENREWATFLLTVAMIGDRLPLRPLFAVWEIVLAALSNVEPTAITMHVSNRGYSDAQPLCPEYLIRSHAYRDENYHSIFHDTSEEAECISCRVMNSEGEGKEVKCKRFSPLRLVEDFELLSLGVNGDMVDFWVRGLR